MKFSNSELQTFKRCKRKWWLAFYHKLRLRSEGVGPLSVGNMVHHPLEAYYGQPDRDPAVFQWQPILAAYVEERLADPRLPVDLHPRMLEDYELAKIMLAGYFGWLQEEGSDADIEVISAEREIEVYLGEILGEQVYLIGKLDTEVLYRSNGFRSFMDHKSVQELKSLPKLIEINEQLRHYGLLQRLEAIAKGTGETQFANGGVLNMIRKVKRTASSKPPYFDRAGTQHNDTVYRNFYTRVWGEVTDLLLLRKKLDAGADHQMVAYPTPGMDCDWSCPFKLICPRFDDGSDVQAIIAEQYESHDPLARYTEVEKG